MDSSADGKSSSPELDLRTLYINNINEKVKKDVCKRMLNMVFSQYGKLLKITSCSGIKLRGQAWLVFETEEAAAKAIKDKQGFNFYGKPLKIAFSANRSAILDRKRGSNNDSSNYSSSSSGGGGGGGGNNSNNSLASSSRKRDRDDSLPLDGNTASSTKILKENI